MTKASRLPRVVPVAARAERFLCGVGVHPAVAEQLVGDLVESYYECSARFGVAAARRDCVRQLARSLPYLAVDAWRNGTPLQRARFALAVAIPVAIAASVPMIAARSQLGPPARLFAEHATSDSIVVNNTRAALLPMRVADDRGRRLDPRQIRYGWISGIPIGVSPNGEIACTEPGDAVVRASAGAISTDVVIRCRPVAKIEATAWMTLVEGGAPQEVPFSALGLDGKPVAELRGALRVRDSSIATLSGASIRPVTPGETQLVVQVGDVAARIRILVHKRVEALSALGPNLPLAAVPVSLAQGDTVRLAIPKGVYWVKYVPERAGDAPPSIFTDVTCGPGDGLRTYRLPVDEHVTYCMIMHDGSVITLGHGRVGAAVVRGTLAVERVEYRW